MRKGFTLIELMIVIAIIAIIAAIAIPNLLESRVTANEAAASASLKSGVFPAETQFQSGGSQDADGDNRGEYGTIEALAGIVLTTKVAVNEIRLVTGPLSAAPAIGGAAGMRTASGYQFMAFLPALDNAASTTAVTLKREGEAMTTVAQAQGVDAGGGWACNSAENFFIATAMPERYSDTGRRTFIISQDGQVRSPAPLANISTWWGGAPAAGVAGSAALLQTGFADFSGGITDPKKWSRADGVVRGAATPETYPVLSK